MRAQFHHENCASWGRFGALLVAVKQSLSVFEFVTLVKRFANKEHSAVLDRAACNVDWPSVANARLIYQCAPWTVSVEDLGKVDFRQLVQVGLLTESVQIDFIEPIDRSTKEAVAAMFSLCIGSFSAVVVARFTAKGRSEPIC